MTTGQSFLFMRQSIQSLEDFMAKKATSKKELQKKKSNDIWVIAIIAFFAVVIIGMIIISKLPKPPTKVEWSTTAPVSGLTIGDPNAKVVVEEFADFQCPWCQYYFQEIEPTILSQYVETGQVYYKYIPLAFLGQESVDAAQAAYCANDQGKFWEYRAYLYTNLTGENVGSYEQKNLIAFAKSLDLDINTFTTCLTTAAHTQEMSENDVYAQSAGMSYTPSFLVNGTLVSANDLQAAIQ
jgi:protein-disulfide isomerase